MRYALTYSTARSPPSCLAVLARDRKYIIHNTIHNAINTYNTSHRRLDFFYFVLLGLQPEPEAAAAAVCYHYQCPHVHVACGPMWYIYVC
jgi:hypothetical protein